MLGALSWAVIAYSGITPSGPGEVFLFPGALWGVLVGCCASALRSAFMAYQQASLESELHTRGEILSLTLSSTGEIASVLDESRRFTRLATVKWTVLLWALGVGAHLLVGLSPQGERSMALGPLLAGMALWALLIFAFVWANARTSRLGGGQVQLILGGNGLILGPNLWDWSRRVRHSRVQSTIRIHEGVESVHWCTTDSTLYIRGGLRRLGVNETCVVIRVPAEYTASLRDAGHAVAEFQNVEMSTGREPTPPVASELL